MGGRVRILASRRRTVRSRPKGSVVGGLLVGFTVLLAGIGVPAEAASSAPATVSSSVFPAATLVRGAVSQPWDLATGADGAIWFVGADAAVGRVTVAGQFEKMSDPGLGWTGAIAAGADGTMWVTDRTTDRIARIGAGHDVTFFGDATVTDPEDIVVASDGTVWFTTGPHQPDHLGRISPAGVLSTIGLGALGSASELVADASGGVWIGNPAGEVAHLSGAGVVDVVATTGRFVSGLAAVADGVWVASSDAVINGRPDLRLVTGDGVVDMIALPASIEWVSSLVLGPDGDLWFSDDRTDHLGHVTPTGPADPPAVTVIDHDTLVTPTALTVGPDGNLWFANREADTLGVVTTDGLVSRIAASATIATGSIARDAQGRTWFPNTGRDSIGMVSAGGALQELPTLAVPQPHAVTIGGDGAAWFIGGSRSIGRITADGAVSTFASEALGWPAFISTRPDGSVWVVTTSPATLATVTPAGAVAVHPLSIANFYPHGFATGPDGSFWLILSSVEVMRIRPDGVVSTYAVHASSLAASSITVSPDGTAWVVNLGVPLDETIWYEGSSISRIATDGTVTNLALPSLTTATNIVAGADGIVWFGVHQRGLIGRISSSGNIALIPVGAHRELGTVVADPRDDSLAIGVGGRMVGRLATVCRPGAFVDVGVTQPMCTEIAWMKARGITTGFPDGTFRPEQEVERQALAAFLHRSAGSPAVTPGEPIFADVGPAHPFFEAIQWMGQTGRSLGSPNAGGKPFFQPNAPVTRQAMAAFLYRDAGSPPQLYAPPPFADVTTANPFYVAIRWAAHHGITTGTPSPDGGPTLFKPNEAISRQAMAAFLYRVDVLVRASSS